MREVSLEEAAAYANEALTGLRTRFGGGLAVAVSGSYTNEEAFLIKEYAEQALKTDMVFSFGLTDAESDGVSTAAWDDLDYTELIVAAAPHLAENYGVAAMKIRRAVKKGAKLILLYAKENPLDDIAALRINEALPAMELVAEAARGGAIPALPENGAAIAAADMITKAGGAVFILGAVPARAARLIEDIAAARGGKPGSGVIRLLPEANSRGLINLGIKPRESFLRATAAGEIRGLFVFGEDIDEPITLDFLAVRDLRMTETAKRANVVFPAPSFAEKSGSFTGADGKTRELKPVAACPDSRDIIKQINALYAAAGLPAPVKAPPA